MPFEWADGGPRVGGTCGPTESSGAWIGTPFLVLRPAFLEAVAVAVHLEEVDVMGELVEERAGEALGAEDFGPFVEGQVVPRS